MTRQPVTPAIDNLVLEVDGGAGSVEDLVAGTERGLLLTCIWYIREVDPQTLLLTGLTRDGVYLVEGGEITAAVNNFRWNESPIDLLRRFSHASATVPSFSREWGDDYFSRTATPGVAGTGLQHVERVAGAVAAFEPPERRTFQSHGGNHGRRSTEQCRTSRSTEPPAGPAARRASQATQRETEAVAAPPAPRGLGGNRHLGSVRALLPRGARRLRRRRLRLLPRPRPRSTAYQGGELSDQA